MADGLISERGKIARDFEDVLFEFINQNSSDPSDEAEDSKGFINIGTAVNSLCLDIIFPRISSSHIWSCNTGLLDYETFYGIGRLRQAFATFLTEMMESHEPVSPENLFCVSGVASCIDLLAHCLADPGDVFLMPTPVYGCINTHIKRRSLVDMYPIPLIVEDSEDDYPVLTIEKVVKAYENAVAEGRNVRGVLLLNPNNPLGDIYSPELMMEILTFCHEKSLHVVVDEIYSLSVFKGSRKFRSVFSFSSIPDKDRTHVLYGLSKDFALTGLRIGVIHTKCEPLQKCLIQLSTYQNIPFPLMDIAAKYLEDLEWIKHYVSVNQLRLTEKYKYCVDFLKENGVKMRPAFAGFFLWIDFRDVCKTFAQEKEFFKHLIAKKRVYIGPGKEFFCPQPGWFRLVFARQEHILKEGLQRVISGHKEYQEFAQKNSV